MTHAHTAHHTIAEFIQPLTSQPISLLDRPSLQPSGDINTPSPILPPYRTAHNTKLDYPKSSVIGEKSTCHRTTSQDSGLSTQRSTASSNSSTGQRPDRLSFCRNDSGLGLDSKLSPQIHTIPDVGQLCKQMKNSSASKQHRLPDPDRIPSASTGSSLSGLQFRRAASAAVTHTHLIPNISYDYPEERKLSLAEHPSTLDDSYPSAYRSNHGFIAYDTNDLLDYEYSPRKHKYTEPNSSEGSKSPIRKKIDSNLALLPLPGSSPSDNIHPRQPSYQSEISTQDSEEYDSSESLDLGSGWDTLYQMRSSFRSKLKEKEGLSKSVEPRYSPKEIVREVSILRRESQYGFTLSRMSGVGDTVVELEDNSIASTAGLMAGDIILMINDQDVINLTHRQVVMELNINIILATLRGHKVVELLLSVPVDYTLRLRVKSGVNITKSPSMPLQLGSPSNQPILEGYLYLFNGKRAWKRRWFMLREDRILYYYKSKGDSRALGAIILDGYVITKAFDAKRPYSFNVKKGGGRPYCFSTDNESQMINWAQAMADAAEYQDENRDNIIAPCMANVAYSALSIKKPDIHGSLYRNSGLWSWKRRYCVLKNAQLFVYTKMADTIAEDVIHLFGYRVQEGDTTGPKNFFHLFAPADSPGKDHTLYVESESERTRWLKALISSIKNAFIPNASHSHS